MAPGFDGAVSPVRSNVSLETIFFDWCKNVMTLCGCHREIPIPPTVVAPRSAVAPAAKLKCYYDLSDALVMRQLTFRRTRKLQRDASTNSLSSLGTLSETDDSIEELLLPKVDMTPPQRYSFDDGLVVTPKGNSPATPPNTFRALLSRAYYGDAR